MALYRSIGARKDATRGTTAIEVRKDLAGLLSGVGVLPGSADPLVQGTASFSYQVNAGQWVTSRGASDGVHVWGNDGAITVSTGAAPGSGLSRIDIVYAVHPSNTENGDTDSVPVVGVAQGTAASSPVAPAIPTGALELARNTMTSSATSTNSAGNTLSNTAASTGLVSSDTGQVSNAITSASGWSITSQTVRRVGKTVAVYVAFERTGSAISVPSDGNIGNTQFGTLSAAYRPEAGLQGTLSSSAAGPVHVGYVLSSGVMGITAIAPGATVNTGDTFALGGTWFVP